MTSGGQKLFQTKTLQQQSIDRLPTTEVLLEQLKSLSPEELTKALRALPLERVSDELLQQLLHHFLHSVSEHECEQLLKKLSPRRVPETFLQRYLLLFSPKELEEKLDQLDPDETPVEFRLHKRLLLAQTEGTLDIELGRLEFRDIPPLFIDRKKTLITTQLQTTSARLEQPQRKLKQARRFKLFFQLGYSKWRQQIKGIETEEFKIIRSIIATGIPTLEQTLSFTQHALYKTLTPQELVELAMKQEKASSAAMLINPYINSCSLEKRLEITTALCKEFTEEQIPEIVAEAGVETPEVEKYAQEKRLSYVRKTRIGYLLELVNRIQTLEILGINDGELEALHAAYRSLKDTKNRRKLNHIIKYALESSRQINEEIIKMEASCDEALLQTKTKQCIRKRLLQLRLHPHTLPRVVASTWRENHYLLVYKLPESDREIGASTTLAKLRQSHPGIETTYSLFASSQHRFYALKEETKGELQNICRTILDQARKSQIPDPVFCFRALELSQVLTKLRYAETEIDEEEIEDNQIIYTGDAKQVISVVDSSRYLNSQQVLLLVIRFADNEQVLKRIFGVDSSWWKGAPQAESLSPQALKFLLSLNRDLITKYIDENPTLKKRLQVYEQQTRSPDTPKGLVNRIKAKIKVFRRWISSFGRTPSSPEDGATGTSLHISFAGLASAEEPPAAITSVAGDGTPAPVAAHSPAPSTPPHSPLSADILAQREAQERRAIEPAGTATPTPPDRRDTRGTSATTQSSRSSATGEHSADDASTAGSQGLAASQGSSITLASGRGDAAATPPGTPRGVPRRLSRFGTPGSTASAHGPLDGDLSHLDDGTGDGAGDQEHVAETPVARRQLLFWSRDTAQRVAAGAGTGDQEHAAGAAGAAPGTPPPKVSRLVTTRRRLDKFLSATPSPVTQLPTAGPGSPLASYVKIGGQG